MIKKGFLFIWVCTLGAMLAVAPAACARDDSAPRGVRATLSEISKDRLPAEARETLQRIERGGTFPYDRDGVVFGNFEKRLPVRERGYYQEYTVKTPGVKHRGARRIIAGGCATAAKKNQRSGSPQGAQPPCTGGERYYTDDHYRSFKRVRP